MEQSVTEAFQWIVQFGAIAVLFLGVLAIMRGDLRTRQEVEAIERARTDQGVQSGEQFERQKESYEAAIERLNHRIIQLSTEHERALSIFRTEMQARVTSAEDRADYFRDIALQALQHGFQLASAAEKTVDLVSSKPVVTVPRKEG